MSSNAANDCCSQIDTQQVFQRTLAQQSQALFKQLPEDFVVIEELPFELSGEGEHLYLFIEKTLLTTFDVVQALSRWAGVCAKAVSYSGLKDKWGQTQQWFSVHLPGRENPEPVFAATGCRVLAQARHNKKLRIGAHKKNRFEIILRDVSDIQSLEKNLYLISQQGVPNYFGEQRFGFQRNNLSKAQNVLLRSRRCSRQQRSLYLSALRSYLFNLLLSERVAQQNWNQYIDGDVLLLSGSHSHFSVDAWDQDLATRLATGDISIAGILPGINGVDTRHAAYAIEQQVLAPYTSWLEFFQRIKLKAQRRSLVLTPECLEWQLIDNHVLKLKFSLAAGSFATAVLRELIEVKNPQHYQIL